MKYNIKLNHREVRALLITLEAVTEHWDMIKVIASIDLELQDHLTNARSLMNKLAKAAQIDQ